MGALLVASTGIAFADEMLGEISYRTLIPIIALDKGMVTEVHADIGDHVSSGDVLIEFDPTVHKARVTARKSAVERIKIEVDSLSDKFERQQEMFDRGSLSLLAYEETDNALKTVKAKLKSAQSKLSVAQHYVERTRLRAPMDSIVLSRNIHPGMNVVPELQTEPLMVLASDGNFTVRLDMDFDNWSKLRKSESSVQIDVNGTTFTPDLTESIFLPASSESGTGFVVELSIRDDSGVVVPGTFATVRFQ